MKGRNEEICECSLNSTLGAGSLLTLRTSIEFHNYMCPVSTITGLCTGVSLTQKWLCLTCSSPIPSTSTTLLNELFGKHQFFS